MRTAIVGLGVVGKAMRNLFPDSIVYDEPLGIGTRREVNRCDVAFVCVPTPGVGQGRLDTSVVQQVVAWLDVKLIILRSTVNPGFTDQLRALYGKRIVFQPEYLGETVRHSMADVHNREFIIFGGEPEDRRAAIEVYQLVYNANVRIRQTDALTAEIIKLAENRSIAHKVAEIQELYDLCEAVGVDYYAVREAVYHDDPRMSAHWTFVYPGRRGFNSKCIPKDVYALASYAREVGSALPVTEAILECNERYLTATTATTAKERSK